MVHHTVAIVSTVAYHDLSSLDLPLGSSAPHSLVFSFCVLESCCSFSL